MVDKNEILDGLEDVLSKSSSSEKRLVLVNIIIAGTLLDIRDILAKEKGK